ncbi:tetratricopeptide repeat protein [Ectothiorhodospira haloalkaliphila]|uniref:tetratricopeptide repeat protein n=1 Tax=Ectothiorhodospira haloalkaliphila TaxID=421628 RepID=UPI001EF09E22|nr:tetratricopeptide repeat protein [Ectothiorhodospira haloalkaliphila]
MARSKRPGLPGRFVVRVVTAMPRGLVLLCLLLVCITPAQADRVVDEAMAMARVGAAELALNLLARETPDPRAEPVRWMEREQARIEILGMNGRWEQVVERTARVPVEMPVDFVIWTRTRQAHALVSLGRGEEARDVLRPLIWFGSHNASESWFRSWRRLVAESYILDDRPEDALTALQRYRFDYPDDVARVALMEARLLLSLGRPREAVDALDGRDGHEADALRLLARLRAGDLSAADSQARALARARDVGRDTRDGARYQAVAALAARSVGDSAEGLAIMERALASQRYLGESDDAFRLSADLLWEHYARLGEREANRRQWLLGNDAGWFERAAQLQNREPHLVSRAAGPGGLEIPFGFGPGTGPPSPGRATGAGGGPWPGTAPCPVSGGGTFWQSRAGTGSGTAPACGAGPGAGGSCDRLGPHGRSAPPSRGGGPLRLGPAPGPHPHPQRPGAGGHRRAL